MNSLNLSHSIFITAITTPLVIFLLLICYFFLFFTNFEYPPKEEYKEYVLRFKDNTSLIAFITEKEVDKLRDIIDKNNGTEIQGVNWSGREPSREEVENFNKREKEKAKIVNLYYSSMFFVFVLSIFVIFFLAL